MAAGAGEIDTRNDIQPIANSNNACGGNGSWVKWWQHRCQAAAAEKCMMANDLTRIKFPQR